MYCTPQTCLTLQFCWFCTQLAKAFVAETSCNHCYWFCYVFARHQFTWYPVVLFVCSFESLCCCDTYLQLWCSQWCIGPRLHFVVTLVKVNNWYWERFAFLVQGWSYSPQKGWEGAFLPVSTTCTAFTNARNWDASHDAAQVCVVVRAWNRKLLLWTASLRFWCSKYTVGCD